MQKSFTYLIRSMILLLCWGGAFSLMAQGTVTGKVTAVGTGEALPGVSVLVKGTTVGTVTDVEGRYSLTLSEDAPVLVFSYVGYVSEEIPVAGQSVINVALVEDIKALEEIVVVGYGTMKKGEVTGAISSINMSEIQPIATQRVVRLLQGRAAGVKVRNPEGAPGGNTTIRIRGMTTIQGGNPPRIVIDGFQGGALKPLNPRDIQ